MVLLLRITLLAPDADRSPDITIELKDKRPDAKMQLKVTADVKEVKCGVRRLGEKTIQRVSHDKMYVFTLVHYSNAESCDSPCDKTKEVVVELFKYRRKFRISTDKVRILSEKVPLQDDELYIKRTFTGE